MESYVSDIRARPDVEHIGDDWRPISLRFQNSFQQSLLPSCIFYTEFSDLATSRHIMLDKSYLWRMILQLTQASHRVAQWTI